MKKEMSLFFKEVTARLQGDDQAVKAAKIERKALSSINSQLAALKAKLVDDETLVEDAEEKLNQAFFPTEVFSDNSSYILGIQKAQEALDSAISEKQLTVDTIAYFEAKLTELF